MCPQRQTHTLSDSLAVLQASEHLGVLTATVEGVTDANDSFLRMVGFTREEMEAGLIDWRAMTPPEHRALDESGLEQMQTQGACIPFEKELILRDGTRLPILISGVRLSSEPLKWVCWVADLRALRDADAVARRSDALRSELEAELRGAYWIYEIENRLLGKSSVAEVLNEILDAAIDIAEADFGMLQLVDSGTLRIIAQRSLPEEFLKFFFEVSEETKAASSAALQSRSRVVIEDVAKEEVFIGTAARSVLLNAGIHALQSTPLLGATGEPYGMLTTHSRLNGQPTERALRFLDLLAGQAGHVLQRFQYAELERKSAGLRASARLANSLAHEINNPVQALTNILSLLAGSRLDQPEGQALVESAMEQLARVSDSLGRLLPVNYKALSSSNPGLGKLIDHMREESGLDVRIDRNNAS